MSPPSFEQDGKPAFPEDEEFLRDLNMGISTLWDIIATYSSPYDERSRSGLCRVRIFRCVDSDDDHGEPSFAVLLSFDPAAASKFQMFQDDMSKLNASIYQLLNSGDDDNDEPFDPPFKVTSMAPVDCVTDPEPTNPPCMFCLEPLDSTKSTFTSVCCHTFHVTCLRLWSQTNTCPVCRFDLMASDLSSPHHHAPSFSSPPSSTPLTDSALPSTVADHDVSTTSPPLTAVIAHDQPPPSPLRVSPSPYKVNRATSQCQVCRKNRRVFASCTDLKPPTLPSASAGLWICLICGDSNCGDMETPTNSAVATPFTSASNSHAFDHYASTLHAYALEVTSQKVFNFAEQGFVHRLVSAKGDGKIVQVAGGESSMEPSEWMDEEEEMLWNRKLEGLAAEYNEMLRHELEKTRNHYQEKILAIKAAYRKREKDEVTASSYVDSLKAKEKILRRRARNANEKLEKSTKDFAFVRDLVESLQKNKVGNAEEIAAAENELARVRNMYNNTIPELETKVNQLMLLLDGG
ncbi:hypothetical protein TrRE_jg12579 [Triparma retinervis]|uniref:RING-type domain-containing protein n=1 Tax=Triparma retinervis TaxID=2557542 RepID=A0A9W6ZUC7_9STRA|nr:hypothetical protein TrRE_jg12579 [Triparma retinervis]